MEEIISSIKREAIIYTLMVMSSSAWPGMSNYGVLLFKSGFFAHRCCCSEGYESGSQSGKRDRLWTGNYTYISRIGAKDWGVWDWAVCAIISKWNGLGVLIWSSITETSQSPGIGWVKEKRTSSAWDSRYALIHRA